MLEDDVAALVTSLHALETRLRRLEAEWAEFRSYHPILFPEGRPLRPAPGPQAGPPPGFTNRPAAAARPPSPEETWIDQRLAATRPPYTPSRLVETEGPG